jgi:hypothetical protein
MLRNVSLACLFVFAPYALADDANTKTIKLADGKLVLEVPKDWKQEEPKSRIVQYEFSAPGEKAGNTKEEERARITIMASGGGVEANIDRWYGQFDQPDGKATKNVAKVEKFEAAGQTIHYVDIKGTFKDTMGAGPFSGRPAVQRTDYRMLGAIIESEDAGDFYLKITGPAELLEGLDEGFRKMLKELKAQ